MSILGGFFPESLSFGFGLLVQGPILVLCGGHAIQEPVYLLAENLGLLALHVGLSHRTSATNLLEEPLPLDRLLLTLPIEGRLSNRGLNPLLPRLFVGIRPWTRRRRGHRLFHDANRLTPDGPRAVRRRGQTYPQGDHTKNGPYQGAFSGQGLANRPVHYGHPRFPAMRIAARSQQLKSHWIDYRPILTPYSRVGCERSPQCHPRSRTMAIFGISCRSGAVSRMISAIWCGKPLAVLSCIHHLTT